MTVELTHHSLTGSGLLTAKARRVPLKRTFDLFFSAAFLIFSAPLFFFIALLLLIPTRGKVLYSHERIGKNGKPFRCFKFRTMREDADSGLQEILKQDTALREEWETKRKLIRDPRVTRLGHFLRRTCLDEIPQFWNVLKGDLSVVGPRPVTREEITTYFGDKAQKILSVKPGITGLWQIARDPNMSYKDRVSLEEYYVKKASFLLDLKLIFLTLPCIIRTNGA